MRRRAVAALASIVLSAGTVGAALPANAAAGFPYTVKRTFDITFHEQRGVCDVPETVHIVATFVLHVNATEKGLTDDQILAAFRQEDPGGIFTSASFSEHGSFDVQSGAHTYTGTYNAGFGFNKNKNMDVGRYRFKATGKSEQGTQLTIHFLGHWSDTRQTGFEKGFAKGCLPQPQP